MTAAVSSTVLDSRCFRQLASCQCSCSTAAYCELRIERQQCSPQHRQATCIGAYQQVLRMRLVLNAVPSFNHLYWPVAGTRRTTAWSS